MVSLMGILRGCVAIVAIILAVTKPTKQVDRGNAVTLLTHDLKACRMRTRIGGSVLEERIGTRYQQALLS